MKTELPSQYDPKQVSLYEERRWWLGLTVSDVLDKNADLYPAKEALVAGQTRYTWSQLRQAAEGMAYSLLEEGFEPGDRVLLQLPNWAEFVVSLYALQKAGLVMVLLTVNHSAREIVHLATLTEPKGWILPARYRSIDFGPLVEEVRQKLPALEKVVIAGGKALPGCLNFGHLLNHGADEQTIAKTLEKARPDPHDVCYLLPTGGTTNLPKCAVRTHNDYLCNVEYTSRAWDVNVTDISLVATTVGHNLALLVSVSGPLFHGATIVLSDSTRPEDFCRTVQDERVTCASLVPTLISRFVTHDQLEDYDFSSLKRIYVGAANSPPELVKRAETRLGCLYINAFGMVEGPCSQTRPGDPLEIRTQTIGRPVCPYDEFVTLDEAGEPTPPGTEGEMAAKGPGVFAGYYRNPQTNQFAFTPKGYFRTGDLAVIDQSGIIRITGRIKDIIIRGGENISARDVEDMISSCQGVEYVAAVGMPHQDLGEVVCAFVTPVAGVRLSHEEIVAHLESCQAPKALIPARTIFVEQIPLTAAGKADKKILRREVEQKTNQTAGA